MIKGGKMSEEAKHKISLTTKGVKKSLAMRQKLSKARRGMRWTKRQRMNFKNWYVSGMKGRKHTPETIEKMRLSRFKRKEKLGYLNSLEMRKKISGLNAWNWKGGISPLYKKIRGSKEFKEWRESVFKRDDYTCQDCGQRGGILHPDHIKPFAFFPELRFELSNGRTLCKPCHMKTDSWGHKATKNYGSGRIYI